MPEILTGLGIFGLVTVCALASLFCLFQPIWALVDCVDSDRDRETKVLVTVAILFTWGLGSLVYGIFFAKSSNLRRFTVVATLILAVLTVVSFGSCVSAIATQAKRVTERQEAEQAEALERASSFSPIVVEADAIAPFHAILFARTGRHAQTTALAEFTLAGPILSTARDMRGGIRHVTHDAEVGRTFAITQHAFGAVSATTGEFIEIAVDPSFDFSWPRGLAWDPQSKRVIVMTSHVYTRFFSYDPTTSSWDKLPSSIRDLKVSGLAHVPGEDLFYGLAEPADSTELAELQRFNRAGANLGRLKLSPPIPIGDRDDAVRGQIEHSSGKLIVVLPPYATDDVTASDRVYMIDPATGRVYADPSMLITVETASDMALTADGAVAGS